MTALSDLTPIQREAVIATATSWLRDPEDLAEELAPLLLADEPDVVVAWEDLPATESGTSGIVFRLLPPVPPTVNKSLTVPTEQEHTS